METESPYYFENRFTPAITFCLHLRSPTPESRRGRPPPGGSRIRSAHRGALSAEISAGRLIG